MEVTRERLVVVLQKPIARSDRAGAEIGSILIDRFHTGAARFKLCTSISSLLFTGAEGVASPAIAEDDRDHRRAEEHR